MSQSLPRWALRGILDLSRRQSPSMDKAAEICEALGLELYVGPPRSTSASPGLDYEARTPVNGTERCPVFGKIRCPIFCTLRDSNLGCYPEAALPSSSFTATLSIPALRLVLSR